MPKERPSKFSTLQSPDGHRNLAKGKAHNPDYVQLSAYVLKDTHLALKKRLLDEHREISEWVQDQADRWLNSFLRGSAKKHGKPPTR